jgi:hypothetical protein
MCAYVFTTWKQENNGQHENGNMLIDNEVTEYELSLEVGHIYKGEIESINESLEDMGLSLNDPDVWIQGPPHVNLSIKHHKAIVEVSSRKATGCTTHQTWRGPRPIHQLMGSKCVCSPHRTTHIHQKLNW